MEHRPGGVQFKDVEDLVAGTRGRLVYQNGDPDYGIWSASVSIGLINDCPTCKDLVVRIEREAEEIIGSLARFKASPSIQPKL